MADTKTASLTVLGGPLAGTRCVLPDRGSVTVGSDAGSTLLLDLPSVSPLHARIDIEGDQFVVHGTGSERELHVNDNPVDVLGTVLRNGDILWLGSPGDDDVVMLQVVLPRRPVAAPAPATVPAGPPMAAPATPTPEVETVALWAVGQQPRAPTVADIAAESVAEVTAEPEAMAILPGEAPLAEEPAVLAPEDETLVEAAAEAATPAEEEMVFSGEAEREAAPAPVAFLPEGAAGFIPEEAGFVPEDGPAERVDETVVEPTVEVAAEPTVMAEPTAAETVVAGAQPAAEAETLFFGAETFVAAEPEAVVVDESEIVASPPPGLVAETQEVVEAVLPPVAPPPV
ncbi:MAG TPA: FHA domain-containing protein, partial [Vicinamibacteria bacterium]